MSLLQRHTIYFSVYITRQSCNLLITVRRECFRYVRRRRTRMLIWEDHFMGIATCYGLNGPGIESRWGQDFPHPSRPALGPTQPPIQWVPGLSRGKRPGRGVDNPPHLAPRLKKVQSYRHTFTPHLGLRGLLQSELHLYHLRIKKLKECSDRNLKEKLWYEVCESAVMNWSEISAEQKSIK